MTNIHHLKGALETDKVTRRISFLALTSVAHQVKGSWFDSQSGPIAPVVGLVPSWSGA